MGVFYSDHHTALGFLNRISSNYTKVLHVLSHLIPPNLGSWGFKTPEIESNHFTGPRFGPMRKNLSFLSRYNLKMLVITGLIVLNML